jgi:hypothetical protein
VSFLQFRTHIHLQLHLGENKVMRQTERQVDGETGGRAGKNIVRVENMGQDKIQGKKNRRSTFRDS